ncbi:MAG: hypothetical protein Q7U72_11060 [Brevundimonas sp.]|uniref:hypothetical protein n=1 Tax=Brevundimonas sp. TaxID=1871086 RepID=UPI0027278FB2|nr:hypothetical protein [Brevundimonas sp.]MDO9077971.1 hypothetical protein [Brevundimonas sp.]MDP3081880.1 hypothetical protein [Brevundimonas sp.]MDZ4060194.1 hypothetical protein [Brevundimonas sp.]
MTLTDPSSPDTALNDQEFEALASGRLNPEALDRLRVQVQAALDHPDESVSHDEVWTRLEQRMKRAVARAA